MLRKELSCISSTEQGAENTHKKRGVNRFREKSLKELENRST